MTTELVEILAEQVKRYGTHYNKTQLYVTVFKTSYYHKSWLNFLCGHPREADPSPVHLSLALSRSMWTS